MKVYFLPIGHTYKDIDQDFSRTPKGLRNKDAVTPEDLLGALCKTFGGYAQAARLFSIVNWYGLCESERALQPVLLFL